MYIICYARTLNILTLVSDKDVIVIEGLPADMRGLCARLHDTACAESHALDIAWQAKNANARVSVCTLPDEGN